MLLRDLMQAGKVTPVIDKTTRLPRHATQLPMWKPAGREAR